MCDIHAEWSLGFFFRDIKPQGKLIMRCRPDLGEKKTKISLVTVKYLSKEIKHKHHLFVLNPICGQRMIQNKMDQSIKQNSGRTLSLRKTKTCMWLLHVISAPVRLRQEEKELKASLGYVRPCLKTNTIEKCKSKTQNRVTSDINVCGEGVLKGCGFFWHSPHLLSAGWSHVGLQQTYLVSRLMVPMWRSGLLTYLWVVVLPCFVLFHFLPSAPTSLFVLIRHCSHSWPRLCTFCCFNVEHSSPSVWRISV